jgi:hypothetical protein
MYWSLLTLYRFLSIFNEDSKVIRRLAHDADIHKIKIAIIDNGIDIGAGKFAKLVKRGQSFVDGHADCKLPWFTAMDPHGTQMADLITKVNPMCELYIYRVAIHRHDVDLSAAVQVS